MRVVGVGYSTAGPVRPANEDSFHLDIDQQLFMVADGLGGHRGGARASQLVCDSVVDYFQREILPVVTDSSRELGEVVLDLPHHLQIAVEKSSRTIFREASSDATVHGMGTTVTALMHVDGHGVLSHVGDSRLYLLRGGTLHQLSVDHTFVADAVASGKLTPRQALNHPYSHVLTRSVGVQEAVSADTLIFELTLEDRLLLCTDGFYEVLKDDDEILSFVKGVTFEDFQEVIERLVSDKNASDNVTAILLQVEPDKSADSQERARSDEVVLKVETLREMRLFRDLAVRDLCALVQAGEVRRVEAGVEVLTEGVDDRSITVILEGQVEIRRGDKKLAVLSRGNHFGEMSFLLGGSRTASVISQGGTLLEIPSAAIRAMFGESPRSGVEFLDALSVELAERLDRMSAEFGV